MCVCIHVHAHSAWFNRSVAWTRQLRMAARAIMLMILATARGVYVLLEQPNSSTMRYFPDLMETQRRVQAEIGFWSQQFLCGTQNQISFEGF